MREQPPSLPKSAILHIEKLGFKAIQGKPNSFFGRVKSQYLPDPFVVILMAMPLKLSPGRFVFSASYNGNTAFEAKVGSLEDLDAWLQSFALYADINQWRADGMPPDENL